MIRQSEMSDTLITPHQSSRNLSYYSSCSCNPHPSKNPPHSHGITDPMGQLQTFTQVTEFLIKFLKMVPASVEYFWRVGAGKGKAREARKMC